VQKKAKKVDDRMRLLDQRLLVLDEKKREAFSDRFKKVGVSVAKFETVTSHNFTDALSPERNVMVPKPKQASPFKAGARTLAAPVSRVVAFRSNVSSQATDNNRPRFTNATNATTDSWVEMVPGYMSDIQSRRKTTRLSAKPVRSSMKGGRDPKDETVRSPFADQAVEDQAMAANASVTLTTPMGVTRSLLSAQTSESASDRLEDSTDMGHFGSWVVESHHTGNVEETRAKEEPGFTVVSCTPKDLLGVTAGPSGSLRGQLGQTDARHSFYTAVLVGWGSHDLRTRAASLLLFLLCALIHFFLSWYVVHRMDNPLVDADIIQRLEYWFESTDKFFGGGACQRGKDKPMACIACASGDGGSSRFGHKGGAWNWETDLIEAYMTIRGFSGWMFAFCTAIIFATFLVTELVSIVSFVYLLRLPREACDHYIFDPLTDRGEFKALRPATKRFVFVAAIVRCVTFYGLVRWGSALITHATELVEFILECAVLLCVLRFDEVFLYAFSPPQWVHVVRTLDFPVVRNPGRLLLMGRAPLVTCGIAVTFALCLTIFATGVQLGHARNIGELCEEACEQTC